MLFSFISHLDSISHHFHQISCIFIYCWENLNNLSTFLVIGGRIKKKKGEYIMTEKVSIKISDLKVSKILNQIKKELEGIKNELKKSNVLKDKRYKEMMRWKKKWKKSH